MVQFFEVYNFTATYGKEDNMITEIRQNILDNIDPRQPTVIIHGCNCFHTMGAGVAKSLKDAYPQVYQADIDYMGRGDSRKLGHHSVAKINNNLYVLNCYTQYKYGRKTMFADYDAIEKCLSFIGKTLPHVYKIHISKIGCGLAGGDWKVVKAITI